PTRSTAVAHPLSLHDALPIFFSGIDVRGATLVNNRDGGRDRGLGGSGGSDGRGGIASGTPFDPRSRDSVTGRTSDKSVAGGEDGDRKSTRLNSSHRTISYAVF